MPKDYMQGFADGSQLTRQEASDQVAALDTPVGSWDDYDQGLIDGEAFAAIWDQERSRADHQGKRCCDACGAETPVLTGRGRALLCRSCEIPVNERVAELRAAGLPVSVLKIAHELKTSLRG